MLVVSFCKCPNWEFFSYLYFPISELNTEIYKLNVCIYYEYGVYELENFKFGHVLHSQSHLLVIPGIYLASGLEEETMKPQSVIFNFLKSL